MSLDEVAAERLAGAQRRLEVDRRAGLEVAERGQAQGLVHHVGVERRRAAARRRSGRRPRPRPSRPPAARRRSPPRPQIRAPSSPRSIALDRSELADDPGEHHHSRSRALASMSSPLGVHSTASGRAASAIRPGPAPAASGSPAAEHQRGDEQPQLVDSPRRRAASRRGRRRPRPAASATSRRPSSASAASSLRLAVAGELDHLGPGAAQGLDPRRVGAGGGDDVDRRLGRASRSARSRAAAAPRSRRRPAPAGGPRRDRRHRARSAAGRRRARCRSRPRPRRPRRASGGRARGSPAPRSSASRRRESAVKPSRLTADFSVTSGRPVRACLRNGCTSEPRRGGLGAVGELDLDPLVAEDPGAAAGCLLGRVVAADHHPADPGREDRVGARRLAALVRAGLERDVERRAAAAVVRRGARARRRARRPRRAGRRARRGSPRRGARPRRP